MLFFNDEGKCQWKVCIKNLLSFNTNGVTEVDSRESELESMNSPSGNFLLGRNQVLVSVCPCGGTT